MPIEIKKFKFATEIHIHRKKSENFQACEKIYTFTPEEWEELKNMLQSQNLNN